MKNIIENMRFSQNSIKDIIDESMNNFNLCQHLKANIKNVECPKGNEKIYIDILKNYKLCIYNDADRKYFIAYMIYDNKIIKDNFEISLYGINNVTGENISKEDAFNNLKNNLHDNTIKIYNIK